ncbi:MAG: hypothetical protein ACK44B_06845 [Flavobacteriales bacterium]|jgi:hypothetical protein
MIPAPDSHYSCPECGAIHAREEIMSGNTFGAKYYSDGKMEAPMYPDRPFMIRCGQCALIFFLTSDLKISGAPKPGTKIFHAFGLDRDGWKEAIDRKLFRDSDEELGFRVRMNWAAHDLYRNKPGEDHDLSKDPQYVENINRMLSLTTLETAEDLIFAAELNRLKGEFERAQALLNMLYDEHDITQVFPYIKACEQGIEARHTRVLQV